MYPIKLKNAENVPLAKEHIAYFYERLREYHDDQVRDGIYGVTAYKRALYKIMISFHDAREILSDLRKIIERVLY